MPQSRRTTAPRGSAIPSAPKNAAKAPAPVTPSSRAKARTVSNVLPRKAVQQRTALRRVHSSTVRATTAKRTRPLNVTGSRQIYRNTYEETLLQPENVIGVKIPDESFEPSGTIHSRTIYRTVTNSHGVAGMFFGSGFAEGTYSQLVPNSTPSDFDVAGSVILAIGGATGSTANGGGNILFDNTASTGTSTIATPLSDFIDLISSYRLVSAGLKVETAASATNNQGFVNAGSFPKGFFNSSNLLSDQKETDLLNAPFTESQPVQDGPLTAVYAPTDPTSFEYVDPQEVDTAEIQSEDQGLLVAWVSGMPASTPVQFTLSMNHEYLPQNGQVQFGISPSPVDREAVDLALNHLQSLQLVKTSHDNSMFHEDDMSQTATGTHYMMGSVDTKHNLVLGSLLGDGKKKKTGKSKSSSKKKPRSEIQTTIIEQIGTVVEKLAVRFLPSIGEAMLEML